MMDSPFNWRFGSSLGALGFTRPARVSVDGRTATLEIDKAGENLPNREEGSTGGGLEIEDEHDGQPA